MKKTNGHKVSVSKMGKLISLPPDEEALEYGLNTAEKREVMSDKGSHHWLFTDKFVRDTAGKAIKPVRFHETIRKMQLVEDSE